MTTTSDNSRVSHIGWWDNAARFYTRLGHSHTPSLPPINTQQLIFDGSKNFRYIYLETSCSKQLDCSDVHFDALWRLSPLRSGCCQWLPTWLLLAWATHVRSVASQMTEVSMETRSLSSPCTCLTSGSVHAPTRVKRIGDQAHPVLPWPVAHSTTFVDTPWCVWDGCSLRLEGPVHSPMGGSMAAECRTAH